MPCLKSNTYLHPYYGPDPTNHDIKRYTAQAPTCTDPGWAAYDACQREGCGYSTYAEIPASGHSLTHHAAKAATCTEPGWEAYDTCSKCSYSTYQTLPALGHDYQAEPLVWRVDGQRRRHAARGVPARRLPP